MAQQEAKEGALGQEISALRDENKRLHDKIVETEKQLAQSMRIGATFTEAPASINFKFLSKTGFDCMFTLRDTDEGQLLGRASLLMKQIREDGGAPSGFRQPQEAKKEAAKIDETVDGADWVEIIDGVIRCKREVVSGGKCGTEVNARTGRGDRPFYACRNYKEHKR